MQTLKVPALCAVVTVAEYTHLSAGEPVPRGPVAKTWEEAYARMKPWRGEHARGADPSTLEGKIVVGYQGWFSCEGDGSELGWVHWGNSKMGPGHCSFEAWPDMSEASSAECYPTKFKQADGSPASVFSSYHPATVDRHFRWMKEHGIDGAFLQRFVSVLKDPSKYDFRTAVTDNVRNAANRHGRTWCVMYDLSGYDPSSDGLELFRRDWRESVDRMAITKDPSYQHCNGKPLVVLWGVGFPGRKYSVADVSALVDFLKFDPNYGGNSVMLGVPFGWREGVRDARPSPELLELIRKADVVSPWTVGRYNSVKGFNEGLATYQQPDLAWCKENRVHYLPVIFPGFSWKNLMKSRGEPPGTEITRGDGVFYWNQGSQLIRSGVNMLYVAMFDEVDEATAIFKISNTPPRDQQSYFVTNGDQSPDRYLWLTGKLGEALHSGTDPGESLPK